MQCNSASFEEEIAPSLRPNRDGRNDHNEVVILFDMKDVAAAKKLAGSEDLKSTMKSAGVVDQPTMHFLEEPH